jgi:hypothetical protein
MNSRNAAAADAIVAFAPKLNGRAETGDPLEKAGQAILGLLNRAASAAEANYQQVAETGRKLSAQLRGAEDRLRELEAQVRPGADVEVDQVDTLRESIMNNGRNDCQRISRRIVLTGTALALGTAAIPVTVSQTAAQVKISQAIP